jgi:hypothetical protein
VKHPQEKDLALYSGGDLGWFDSWRIRRHVSGCDRCGRRAGGYESDREALAACDEMPVGDWNRLAAEMKANIRLGIEAGECVAQPDRAAATPLSAVHTLLAYASVLLLVAAGAWMQRPEPISGPEPRVVAARPGWIEFSQGEQSLRLLQNGTLDRDVTVSASAGGAMGARFVDSSTGQMVIQRVVLQ